jgi:hypothetical protein
MYGHIHTLKAEHACVQPDYNYTGNPMTADPTPIYSSPSRSRAREAPCEQRSRHSASTLCIASEAVRAAVAARQSRASSHIRVAISTTVTLPVPGVWQPPARSTNEPSPPYLDQTGRLAGCGAHAKAVSRGRRHTKRAQLEQTGATSRQGK